MLSLFAALTALANPKVRTQRVQTVGERWMRNVKRYAHPLISTFEMVVHNAWSTPEIDFRAHYSVHGIPSGCGWWVYSPLDGRCFERSIAASSWLTCFLQQVSKRHERWMVPKETFRPYDDSVCAERIQQTTLMLICMHWITLSCMFYILDVWDVTHVRSIRTPRAKNVPRPALRYSTPECIIRIYV